MQMSSFTHFLSRVEERYNLKLTLYDLCKIAETIKSGKAKLIKASSRGFTYKVRVQSKLLIIVLNRSHSNFITALPMKSTKERATFEKQKFFYEDALYINWVFSRFIKKDASGKACCEKCFSNNLSVDLGKHRIRCENCGHLFKFSKIRDFVLFLSVPSKSHYFEAMAVLDIDLWWKLYKSNRFLDFAGIKIQPIIRDNDSLEYLIYGNSKQRIVSMGCYTVKKLKEVLK